MDHLCFWSTFNHHSCIQNKKYFMKFFYEQQIHCIWKFCLWIYCHFYSQNWVYYIKPSTWDALHCAYNPCMHRSYTCTMKHRSHTLFVHIPPDSAGKNNGKSTIHKKLNWLSGINFTPCKHKMIHKMKNCACMVHVYIFGEYILNVNNSQMNIK